MQTYPDIEARCAAHLAIMAEDRKSRPTVAALLVVSSLFVIAYAAYWIASMWLN